MGHTGYRALQDAQRFLESSTGDKLHRGSYLCLCDGCGSHLGGCGMVDMTQGYGDCTMSRC